jgi:glycosyltransferase involved in cell wall biosynthesis
MPLVSVVLCTYNGVRFISEQLESLAQQTVPVNRLVLRDDGSTDATANIVRDWANAQNIPLVHVKEPAERLGPARSFLTAIAASGPARVHLLADQDDVWLKTKIERAVRALEPNPSQPCLYASRQIYVDGALRPFGTSPMPYSLEFNSAIFESKLTGCTMALNEPLRLLVSRRLPQKAQMHDWWIYLLASCAGKIVFDEVPTMLYRQHAHNVVGAGATGLASLVARLRRAVAGPGRQRSAQLQEFGEVFVDLISSPQRSLIDALTSPSSSCWSRIALSASVPVSRRGWHNRLATRISIATGQY